jgi:hypothetical protein
MLHKIGDGNREGGGTFNLCPTLIVENWEISVEQGRVVTNTK